MRSSFLETIPPIVKNILSINVILFLLSVVSPSLLPRLGLEGSLNDYFGMHYWESSMFNPLQLVTYMFMHGGFMHLLFNMFAVYMFGTALENLWGGYKFLFFYLFAGIGAAVTQQVFWTIEFKSFVDTMDVMLLNNPTNASQILAHKLSQLNLPVTVGASGSVFGLLLAFGWLFPEARLMMLFIPYPIKARVFVLIYGLLELFLGVANFSGDTIAHFAHLGGMLFGFILLIIWKYKKSSFN